VRLTQELDFETDPLASCVGRCQGPCPADAERGTTKALNSVEILSELSSRERKKVYAAQKHIGVGKRFMLMRSFGPRLSGLCLDW